MCKSLAYSEDTSEFYVSTNFPTRTIQVILDDYFFSSIVHPRVFVFVYFSSRAAQSFVFSVARKLQFIFVYRQLCIVPTAIQLPDRISPGICQTDLSSAEWIFIFAFSPLDGTPIERKFWRDNAPLSNDFRCVYTRPHSRARERAPRKRELKGFWHFFAARPRRGHAYIRISGRTAGGHQRRQARFTGNSLPPKSN